jgi:hypothetical protein
LYLCAVVRFNNDLGLSFPGLPSHSG